jgi:small subunit ribosomal protein S1
VNDLIRGQVVRAATFGVFVELAPGVEGLCHNIEIPGAPERRGDKRQQLAGDESPLPLGAEFEFKIIKMNETDKKIGLSLKELLTDEERRRIEEYQRKAEEQSAQAESVIRGDAGAPPDDGS